MGALSALGNDVASTWAGLLAGKSGVRTITMFDPSRVDSKIAAEVRDFDPSAVIDRKEMRRMDRYIQFGLVVARQALDQAGLPGRLDGSLAERTGVILGSGLGGVATLFDNVLLMAERGPDRISPFFIPMGIPNVGSGQVAIAFGMLGPNFATVSACATGAHAIGEAWETIRRDDADVMLAGGTEAAIHEAVVGGFASMKALSTRNDDPEGASRPFDQGRDGFVIGEGAGMLVLEELSHAEQRGATPLAELVGYGATADANHITLPAPGGAGAVRAGRRALEKAAHGAGRDRARQRPRHLDPGGRRRGAPGAEHAPRRARAGRLDQRTEVDARPHARGRGRDRVDRDDPGDARWRGAADDQPRIEPDPNVNGLDLTPEQRDPTRDPGRAEQLVRVRRPERRARVPAVGRMSPDSADASLLGLIDRLAALLERTDLSELEVQHGQTGLVLRKPSAVATAVAPAAAPAPTAATDGAPSGAAGAGSAEADAFARPVGQGAAQRHLVRLAGARLRDRTSASAARSRSARSSGSSRR